MRAEDEEGEGPGGGAGGGEGVEPVAPAVQEPCVVDELVVPGGDMPQGDVAAEAVPVVEAAGDVGLSDAAGLMDGEGGRVGLGGDVDVCPDSGESDEQRGVVEMPVEQMDVRGPMADEERGGKEMCGA